jgi:hypothetical protein
MVINIGALKSGDAAARRGRYRGRRARCAGHSGQGHPRDANAIGQTKSGSAAG